MLFDLRKKTLDGSHAKVVPPKSLMTKGVGIRNIKKVNLAKTYKSSTIVNMPSPIRNQA
jgi:hypothetical protein